MTTEKPHQSSFSMRLTPGPPRDQIVFSSPLAVNSSALPEGTGLEMETQGFFPPPRWHRAVRGGISSAPPALWEPKRSFWTWKL